MGVDEEHYKFITTQISARDMRAYEYLKAYVQFYSAIVGGSIWLRTQYHLTKPHLARYTILSDTVMLLGAISVTLLIIDTFKSWHGYRTAQVALAEKYGDFEVPLPKLKAGVFMELNILVCVWLSAAGFMIFNPFQNLG